jgi:MFS family permease
MGVRSAAPGQLALLRRPDVGRLFWATLISSSGTWLAAIALSIDVFQRTSSSLWVGALLVADFFPIAIIGITAGPLIDRLPRRSLMIVADLCRAAVFALVIFAPSAWVIVALVAAGSFAGGLFRPAVYAGLPNLVEERELARVNGLFQTAENLTMIIGPLAGGSIVAASGTHPAYLLNAVSFVVSAFLLAGLRPSSLQSEQAVSRGHLADLADGIRVVLRSRPLQTVFIAWNVAMIGMASMNTLEPGLMKNVFRRGVFGLDWQFGLGLLIAASGAGLLLGSLNAHRLLGVRLFPGVYVFGFALIAVGCELVALLPPLLVAALFLAIGGFGNGLLITANGMLVQQGAPDKLRGRAFTLIMSANAIVYALAALGAGAAADHLGIRLVWALAGAEIGVAGVVAGLLARPLTLIGTTATEAVEPTVVEPAPEAPLNF